MPRVIEARLSGPESRDHVRAELSTYLAQIARDDWLPQTTLALLLDFLVDPAARGTAESYAALIACEELALDLVIDDVAPIVQPHGLDASRVGRLHRSLTELPPDALRGAARRVWSRLFEASLAPLE
jgi:hypothetical protein